MRTDRVRLEGPTSLHCHHIQHVGGRSKQNAPALPAPPCSLQDGLGQLGTLLFGKAIAHSFDVNARGWYLAASAKLNVAMG